MKAEVNIGEFNKLVEGIKAKGLEAQKILWDEIQLSTAEYICSVAIKSTDLSI